MLQQLSSKISNDFRQLEFKLTILIIWLGSGSVLTEANLSCHNLQVAAMMKMSEGARERILCSKRSVKSKSLRQLAGPKVFSEQGLVAFSRCARGSTLSKWVSTAAV